MKKACIVATAYALMLFYQFSRHCWVLTLCFFCFHMTLSFSGLPMNKLYMMCRERFLVSSQVTLNSHLTEFKDHELVKTRRSADGQDCFYIPLASEALEKLLQELGWMITIQQFRMKCAVSVFHRILIWFFIDCNSMQSSTVKIFRHVFRIECIGIDVQMSFMEGLLKSWELKDMRLSHEGWRIYIVAM